MTVFCPDIADRLLLRQGEQSEIHRPIRAVDRVLAFDQQSATLSGGGIQMLPVGIEPTTY